MDEDEVWGEIEGYPHHVVSQYGRVWNLKTDYILKPNLSGDYPAVFLVHDGVAKRHLIHRLVAIAFVPGRTERRRWVNHIDGDKSYYYFENLEWVTPVENMKHAFEMGLSRW